MNTQGKRVDEKPDDSNKDWRGYPFPRLQPGEYGKGKDGIWYCIPPETDLIGNLGSHKIIEHEDGTITVSPSILIGAGIDITPWHGYLERGIWRRC